MKTFQKEWQPIEFEAKEIHLVSREGEEPFDVRYSVQLGDSKPTGEFKENPKVFQNYKR